MLYQNIQPAFQGNQMNKQKTPLIQYHSNVTPLDPLGLQGTKYTILEPSKYQNNPYVNHIAYNQPTQVNKNNGIQMNQNQINAVPVSQQNNQNKMLHQQAYMNQNIPQQINYNNKAQPLIYQHQVQHQPIQQHQINPQLQPNYQNQKVQMQPQGYPSQNPCKKINVDKKNEHFVNRPIYPIRKLPSYPLTMQLPQKQLNKITNITVNQKLNNGIKKENNKNNSNLKISQKQPGEGITHTKIDDKKLSMIQGKEKEKENEKEKEKDNQENRNDMDIKKSAKTIKQSQISNNPNKLSESKITVKNNPEAALSNDISENNSQSNIIKKSISQSVTSEFDANLSHLPTIFSIMKGNSQPLPPLKTNKYGK